MNNTGKFLIVAFNDEHRVTAYWFCGASSSFAYLLTLGERMENKYEDTTEVYFLPNNDLNELDAREGKRERYRWSEKKREEYYKSIVRDSIRIL